MRVVKARGVGRGKTIFRDQGEGGIRARGVGRGKTIFRVVDFSKAISDPL